MDKRGKINHPRRKTRVFHKKDLKTVLKTARIAGLRVVHRRKPYPQKEMYCDNILAFRAVNNGDCWWCAEYIPCVGMLEILNK